MSIPFFSAEVRNMRFMSKRGIFGRLCRIARAFSPPSRLYTVLITIKLSNTYGRKSLRVKSRILERYLLSNDVLRIRGRSSKSIIWVLNYRLLKRINGP